MNRYEISVQLRMKSPLLIASGRPRWGADLATTLDPDERPYIPGTSLRGRLRHTTRCAARALGLWTCGEPNPEAMCGDEAVKPAGEGVAMALTIHGNEQPFCALCRLFGSPGVLPSRVMVSDLYWAPTGASEGSALTSALIATQTHVSINRKRRTAEKGRLFALEATAAGAEFVEYSGTIVALLPEQDAELMGLLVAGLCQLESVGGHNSRGLGWFANPGVEDRDTPVEGQGRAFRLVEYGLQQAERSLRALCTTGGAA